MHSMYFFQIISFFFSFLVIYSDVRESILFVSGRIIIVGSLWVSTFFRILLQLQTDEKPTETASPWPGFKLQMDPFQVKERTKYKKWWSFGGFPLTRITKIIKRP